MHTPNTPNIGPSSLPAPAVGPGEQVLREALGDDAYPRLEGQAKSTGPHAALARVLLDTAREADRLYRRLRTQAAHARDRLTDVLDERRSTTFIPVSGLTGACAQSTDLLAARTAQQLGQLGLVLDAYNTAHNPAA
jgi:hypothetical protein